MQGTVQDKVLVTIIQSKSGVSILGNGSKSYYVPLQANVHYLRTFITGRYSSSKDSVFLFAYGNLLNNNDTMAALQARFADRAKQGGKGIEIQIASMASF